MSGSAMENLGTAASEEAEADSPAQSVEQAADTQLKAILCDVLGLDPNDAADFGDDTGLFGHLPELDSMAVAGLLTEMEDRLDIIIEDEDVDGEMLETYGGLLGFALDKLDDKNEATTTINADQS